MSDTQKALLAKLSTLQATLDSLKADIKQLQQQEQVENVQPQ